MQPAYQKFVDARDWNGLEKHYADLVSDLEGQEAVAHVDSVLGDLSEFSESLSKSYSSARALADSKPDAKAIYFEYFYDGDEWCNGEFFLCNRYSESPDSDWFADVIPGSTVSGPFVGKLLNFTSDEEDFEPSQAIFDYAHARFLSCFGRIWEAQQASLPVGFARHESDIVHFR